MHVKIKWQCMYHVRVRVSERHATVGMIASSGGSANPILGCCAHIYTAGLLIQHAQLKLAVLDGLSACTVHVDDVSADVTTFVGDEVSQFLMPPLRKARGAQLQLAPNRPM